MLQQAISIVRVIREVKHPDQVIILDLKLFRDIHAFQVVLPQIKGRIYIERVHTEWVLPRVPSALLEKRNETGELVRVDHVANEGVAQERLQAIIGVRFEQFAEDVVSNRLLIVDLRHQDAVAAVSGRRRSVVYRHEAFAFLNRFH